MRMHSVFRAMLGCGLGVLLTAGLGIAQQPVPEGLRHVPPYALGFIHFRAGEFLKGPLGKTLLHELRQDREAGKALKTVEQFLGIEAADLESVTLVLLAPSSGPRMRGNMPPRGPSYNKRFPRDFDMPKPKFDKDEKKIEDKKTAAKESPVLFQDDRIRQPVEIQDGYYRRLFHGHTKHGMNFGGFSLQEDDLFDIVDPFDFSEPLVIVSSTKPLDRKKILRQLRLEEMRPSVLFLSDRTVMLGVPWELAHYSELMARDPAPKGQPLKSALAIGAKPHLVVAGGHFPAGLRRMYFSPFDSEMRWLASVSPLFQTEAALALDLGKSVDLKLQFNAPTEASAAIALQAVKSLRVLSELAVEKGQEVGESGGAKLELEKALLKGLADAVIEQNGTTVRAELKLELGPAFYKRFTKDIVAHFRQQGDRTQSVNNLKQIGLALHNHHDANKRFPAAGIGDRDGKPLLSWRVAILPYIEQGALYQQFDLNQPWDHPTNKKLIARMPATYAMAGAETKEGMTHYRVLVGGGAMFEPRMGISFAQVTDGLSNTFMVVEAGEPTIWTRPDDLPYDPKGPLPKFGVSPDGFNALLGDGSVRFIRLTTPEEILRAMITRNGGEAFSLPD